MASTRTVQRISAALLVAIMATWMMTFVMPLAPAKADPLIVQTSPSNHETISSRADRITLLFDRPIDGAVATVAVTSAGGGRLESGKAVVKGISVVQKLNKEDVRGDVMVGYRLILKNGRVITGGFAYAVAAAGPTSPPTDPPAVIASALAQVEGREQAAAGPQAAGPVSEPQEWWRQTWVAAAGAVVLLVAAGFVVLSPQRSGGRD